MTARTDLDTSTVDPEYAAAFAVEFLVWWHHAGKVYYGKIARERDDGLNALAGDAVTAVGGWANARRVIRSEYRSAHPMADAAEILPRGESQ